MEAQTAVLAIAAILGWGYLLFFVMAFRLTGPFVVMIYQMLFNDVLRFCIIYMVFLAGFSQAFFILFDYNGRNKSTEKMILSFNSRFQWILTQCETMFSRHVRRFRS